MTAELLADIWVVLAPWIALYFTSSENKRACRQLEDVCGCNGDVHVSVDENGFLILQGPYEEHIEVGNWVLDSQPNDSHSD